MQTFLPLPDTIASLEALDYQRLGKQRLEAFQLLCALGDSWAVGVRQAKTGKVATSHGWKNHPAAKMWKGYEGALRVYYNFALKEWVLRGYENTMLEAPMCTEVVVMPPWFGQEDFHVSHRSNLLRKDPIFYGKYGWTEPHNLPYVWPIT